MVSPSSLVTRKLLVTGVIVSPTRRLPRRETSCSLLAPRSRTMTKTACPTRSPGPRLPTVTDTRPSDRSDTRLTKRSGGPGLNWGVGVPCGPPGVATAVPAPGGEPRGKSGTVRGGREEGEGHADEGPRSESDEESDGVEAARHVFHRWAANCSTGDYDGRRLLRSVMISSRWSRAGSE